ncbi:hypothetical protein QKW35_20620 [Pontibacterium granulatum]|uniref:phage head spike fiber domain-containing protein n=1 Tax=Pontibacterium granulatum TaxID=2036029 RepID=UPI00249BF938|nr:hypothetical protein [Pontibacterium granulatum]MDI3326788.1 hypothetical protein [Pontibacterium granulatum]
MRKLKGYATSGHPMARHFRGHVPFPKSRLIRRFMAAVGTHVKIPAWTVSGDFEIIIRMNRTTDGYILAGPTTRLFNYNGYLKLSRHNADNTQWANGTYVDGVIHEIRVSRVSDLTHGSIDGDALTPQRTGDRAGNYTFDRIGMKWDLSTAVPDLDSYLLSVALKDLDNPSNSRLYTQFGRADGVVPNQLQAWGAELSNGSFYAQGSGTVSGAVLTATADSWAYIAENIETTPGTQYRLEVIAETSGSEFYIRAWDNQDAVALNTAFNFESGSKGGLLFTAQSTSTRVYVQQHGNMSEGDTLALRVLSIREDNTAAQLYNAADGSVQRYTKKPFGWTNEYWPNLISHSRDLLQAWWHGTGVTLSDPGLTEEGIKLTQIEVTADSPCQIEIGVDALEVGKTYTLSMYARQVTWEGGFQLAYYDVPTIMAQDWISLDTTLRRIAFTFTVSAHATNPRIRLAGYNPAAEVGQIALVGGVQLNEGDQALPYKETIGQAGMMIPIAQEAAA